MKLFKDIAIALAFVTTLALPVTTVHAAGAATMTLGSNGSATTGSTVSVTVYENGDAVNVVTAGLSYDQSQLQYLSVDASQSGFNSDASTSGGGGSIQVSRFVAGGAVVSGSQLVAIVNFKALGASGSTSVSTTSSTQIASNGADIWNGVASSTGIALSAPVAAPVTRAPVKATGPAPSTSSSTATTGTDAATTTPDSAPIPTTTKSSDKKSKTTPANIASIETKNTSNTLPATITSLLIVAVAAAIAFYIYRRRNGAQVTQK